MNLLVRVAGSDSLTKMSQALKEASDGTLRLSKNQQIYEQGTKGAVSATRALEVAGQNLLSVGKKSIEQQIVTNKHWDGSTKKILAYTRAVKDQGKGLTESFNSQIRASKALTTTGNDITDSFNRQIRASKASTSATVANTSASKSSASADNASSGAKASNTGAVNQNTNSVKRNTKTLASNVNVAGSASFAAVSMGQAFQDAGQFGMGAAQGIRAVTNNVQQTVQAFTILAEQQKALNLQTGKTISTFAAFRTAMVGPVGMLFAFGAITAAIEGFANYSQRSSKNLKDINKSAGDFVKITQGIEPIELGVIGLTDAYNAQKKVVDDLEVTARHQRTTSLKESRDQEEALRKQGYNTKQIVAIQQQGTIEARENLAIGQEVLQSLRDQLIQEESKLRVAEAMRRNWALNAAELENSLEDEVKLETEKRNSARDGFSIANETYKLSILRTENARIHATESLDLLDNTEEYNSALEEAIRLQETLLGIDRDRLVTITETLLKYKQMANAGDNLPDDPLDLGDPLEVESKFQRIAGSAVKAGQMISSSMGQAGSSLMQLAKTGEETDMRMFNTGKKIAIASAVVNTATGITRAYKDLPIWAAIPASAVIAAAGAAQIATIRSAKPASSSSPKSSSAGKAPNLISNYSNVSQIPSAIPTSGFGPLFGASAQQYAGSNGFGSLSSVPPPSQRAMAVDISLVAEGDQLIGVINDTYQQRVRTVGTGALAMGRGSQKRVVGIKNRFGDDGFNAGWRNP
jgi:hypothetical protein